MSAFDATIVGGGLAGLVTAIGLADGGRRVAIVEPRPPAAPNGERTDGGATAFDLRVSTFSPASIAILRAVNAWQRLPSDRSFEFDSMAVWEDDPAAALRFEAADGGLPNLGAVAENERVRHALWEVAAERCEIVEGTLESLDLDGAPRVNAGGQRLRSQVVIGADGPASAVREAAGIRSSLHEYFQSGVVGVLETELPHGSTARQRFLPSGPLAFLPLAPRHISIVWTLPTARAQQVAGLDDQRFGAEVLAASQGVLGQLTPTGPRAAFPLRRRSARRYADGRCALVGDAAHQIHPLAGQGANLGLLDAAAVVECLLTDEPPERALRRYARWRRSDAEIMAWGVHALGAVYGWQGLPGHLRRWGTAAVGRIPGLTGLFLRHASGLAGRIPQLARGALAPTS